VGQLYPVLVTKEGEVIDGVHRKQADPNWKEMALDWVKTREDYLIARVTANYRRPIENRELKAQITELAELFSSKGVPKGELAKALAEKLPYSEKTILNLLPAKYKVAEKREAGLVSARVRAERREEEAKAERPPTPPPAKFRAAIECSMCRERIELEVDCKERMATVLP